MAFAPRVELSPALPTAVVETASAFLTSERPASWQMDALYWKRPGLPSIKAQCRTKGSRRDPRICQGPSDGPRRCPRLRILAEPRRKSKRNATWENSDAATVAMAWTASVRVAAKTVGVATTTTAAGVTLVVEAGEAHWVVWLRAPPRRILCGSTTRAVDRSSAGGNGELEVTESREKVVWLRAPPRGKAWSNICGGWP